LTTFSIPAFRPMPLAELLDQAIHLYRRNFVTFVGIIAIPYIPLAVVQAALALFATDSLTRIASDSSSFQNYLGPILGSAGVAVTFVIQFFLIQGIATAALTRAIADSYSGKHVDIISSYKDLRGQWGRLILALLLIFLIMAGLLIWMVIPCIGWLTGPGVLAFVGGVVTPLIAPVVVLENNGVRESLRRAWDLARSRFWWLVGFAFILYLFNQLVIGGPSLLLHYLLTILLPDTGSFNQQLILTTAIQTLVSMVTSLIYLPLQLSALTVVYFDLRARSEGLDLVMQTANVSSLDANAVVSLPEVSQIIDAPKIQSPFITGRDIGYFSLMTMAAIALYILVVSVLAALMMAAGGLLGGSGF